MPSDQKELGSVFTQSIQRQSSWKRLLNNSRGHSKKGEKEGLNIRPSKWTLTINSKEWWKLGAWSRVAMQWVHWVGLGRGSEPRNSGYSGSRLMNQGDRLLQGWRPVTVYYQKCSLFTSYNTDKMQWQDKANPILPVNLCRFHFTTEPIEEDNLVLPQFSPAMCPGCLWIKTNFVW